MLPIPQQKQAALPGRKQKGITRSGLTRQCIRLPYCGIPAGPLRAGSGDQAWKLRIIST